MHGIELMDSGMHALADILTMMPLLDLVRLGSGHDRRDVFKDALLISTWTPTMARLHWTYQT